MMKILNSFLKIIGAIIGAVLLYVVLAYFIPMIPVSEESTSEPKVVEAYILTNGVHTDIVVPLKNEYMDWTTKMPLSDTKGKSTDFQYASFGWGDKGFYLDTPTWAELKPSTAIKAAFWLGHSAMHVTYYKQMKEADDCKKITLTANQYQRLVQYIDTKFYKNQQGQNQLIPTNAVYGNNDAFYDANGSYSFLYTCNTWANGALKAAGQKAAIWSPSDFGIFQHYK